MTSRTSTPFKILFEKLIRTHHSCKSKKTPVYSYLKSIMPEKPRFEVHLPITKSNWNFQVWLFKQERLWKSYRLRPGHITKSHALMTIWTQWYNFVKKTERLPALQDVVIGVKPPIHQVTTRILSCTPQSFIACQWRSTKPHQTLGKRVQLTWMLLNTSEGSVRQLKYPTFYLPPEEDLECIAHLVC